MKTALIDGDIALYRCAAVHENVDTGIDLEHGYEYKPSPLQGTLQGAIETLIEFVSNVVEKSGCDDFKFFVSKRGKENNFRYRLFPEYKANRSNQRPKWLGELTLFAEEYFKERFAYGDFCEADDMLGMNQTKDTVICSIDKDLLMIPGWHYNMTRQTLVFISPEEGKYNFYQQILMGDAVDGIKGLWRIGPKKSQKILAAGGPDEWHDIVRDAYDNDALFIVNYNLLRIWTQPWQLYTGETEMTIATREEFETELERLRQLLKDMAQDSEFEPVGIDAFDLIPPNEEER